MTDTSKTAPTVGRTVHYTDNPNFGGGHARCFEAEVLYVNPDGTLDVEASEDDAATRAFAIIEGKPGDLYTWHCCHRLDPHEHTADGLVGGSSGRWSVNTVNGSIALQTAHKLRSAAAALLADSEAQADPRLADSLMYEAGEIRARADSIEEQVKPTVAEPSEFGSIVRATCGPGLAGLLWQRSPMQGKHYWESETGAVEVWPELTDVEVLRIGVGEAAKPRPVEELVGVLTDPNWRPGPDETADVAPEETEDYKAGVTDTAYDLRRKLSVLRSEAITSERKSAYDAAIEMVAALLGES